jgi:plasmid stabilization system protein ParE
LQKQTWNLRKGDIAMPRGDKSSYTDKQKRQAEHIEEGYEKKGVSKKEAESRAWATVNKETGGGKKSGSGRGKKTTRSASKKGGKKAAKKKSAKKSGKKSSSKTSRKK